MTTCETEQPVRTGGPAWLKYGCIAVSAAFCLGAVGYNASRLSHSTETLVCHQPVHDFGTMSPNDSASVRAVFRLKNETRRPLSVRRVTSSCGCLVPAKIGGTVVPPGHDVELPVKLAMRGVRGNVSKVVMVEVEGAGRPPVRLVVQGQVRGD